MLRGTLKIRRPTEDDFAHARDFVNRVLLHAPESARRSARVLLYLLDERVVLRALYREARTEDELSRRCSARVRDVADFDRAHEPRAQAGERIES